ncbi:capsular biosynthesis protein [Ensifer sp. ENS09]|uniref:capsular polysaccharide export protein, LipB/KpsS family n=1 Tax=Ensifer sp. ENS09 TaxID=2769263 RepID=UPI0017865C78|nr:capsular biosynthesis protein [Ensifer sp. ENS09]MBD9652989.1 capsular biosynthesis protein [Ensifer sp. ENS09]
MNELDEVSPETTRPWHPRWGSRIGASFFVQQAFPWLRNYFGDAPLHSTLSSSLDGIVSWGGRLPAKAAIRIARLRGLPHWHLEDGFLRSVGLGKEGSVPISIVIDDKALPVEAGRASRLELLIAEAGRTEFTNTGAAIREALVANKLSKYNSLPHHSPRIERTNRRRVLLVDQVYGDVSVAKALGSPASFHRMLDDALASGAQCVVRTHPDVIAGHRRGYMTERAAKTPGIILMADKVSAASILEIVDEVWTVSSQMGFDALLRGLPVRCYATPFYAGWGLTDDRSGNASQSTLRRRSAARPTLDQLTFAALSLYPVYRHPETWVQLDTLAAIDYLVKEIAQTRREA